jgi:hypothetical protein
MTRLNIRVKHHPNGTSTLSGIPTRNVRDLFNLAFNQLYGLLKQYKANPADPHHNDPWLKVMQAIIDQGGNVPRYRHGFEDVPVIHLDKTGRFCRFWAVREAQESRARVDEIMGLFVAAAEQRKAKTNDPS